MSSLRPPIPEIRLRWHHALCMLTYSGASYTSEFTENFNALIKSINQSGGYASVTIVAGKDDICQPMHPGCRDYHCERGSVKARDRLARRDLEALVRQESLAGVMVDRLPLKVGTVLRLTPDVLIKLRRAFAEMRIRAACSECPWHERCTERAAIGFEGARLAVGMPEIAHTQANVPHGDRKRYCASWSKHPASTSKVFYPK